MSDLKKAGADEEIIEEKKELPESLLLEAEEEEDFEISNTGGNAEDNRFDEIVGVLQDVVLEPKF